MLCSNCSHEVRPIVAIDVDGTLGDYHGHFINFMHAYLGLEDEADVEWIDYDGTEPFSEWCERMYEIDLATFRTIKLAYRQGGMKRTMPIRTGAQALCWAVKDAGAELWITTTRPYLALDNIVPDTVEWLRRHEIEYDGLLFDEDKYAVLADRVDSRRVVAVLDDLPEMYDAAARALHYGWDVPILVASTYNRGVRRTLTSSLDACCDLVLAKINWWKEEHGR